MSHPCHNAQLASLKRIEGQIRGIQKMIEDKRYCVDILTQLSAVNSAVKSVQNKVLEKHLDTCVSSAFDEGSKRDKQKKIDEIISVLKTFRKVAA